MLPTRNALESQTCRPLIHICAMDVQKVLSLLERCDQDTNRFLLLRYIQRHDNSLFYRVLLAATEQVLPFLYTPTIGAVCQRYFHLPINSYGLWLTAKDATVPGVMLQHMRQYQHQNIQVVVVTDGERVLGLGDLGAGGMGICEGKSLLYTAAAGVAPDRILPVHIDVGTNNATLLQDAAYQGCKHERLTGAAYHGVLQAFMEALHAWRPHALVQFEDFANHNAFQLLQRYRQTFCCFNDDIQGTACIALATLLVALQASGQTLRDVRLLFLGAGEAGTGIADLVALALQRLHGIPMQQAREHCVFMDSKGLVCDKRTNLQPHKLPYAHALPPCSSLVEAVRLIRPAALIGVSTIRGAFTPQVLQEMAAINTQPIIFPLSNPTANSECTFAEAVESTKGTVLFASGSPFSPVTHSTGAGPRVLVATQANNAYVFPAVGHAAVLARAACIPDDVFLVAAQALASMTGPAEWRRNQLLPPFSTIQDVSARLMTPLCMHLCTQGIGSLPEDWQHTLARLRILGQHVPADNMQICWDAYIRANMYTVPAGPVHRL